MNYLLLLVAVLPVVFLMILIYFSDKIEKEPVGLIIKIMLLGAISVIPACLMELLGEAVLKSFLVPDTVIYHALNFFFIVGISEEVCKFIFMLLATWKNKSFDYAFDGIIYAVASSLGFALIENLLYVLWGAYLGGFESGMTIGVMRAVLAIPFHTVFSIFMGYFYGKAKEATFQHRKAGKYLILSVFIPAMIHGAYDFMVTVVASSPKTIVLFLLFVILMYIFTINRCIKFSKSDHNITGRLTVKISPDGWFRYAILDTREVVILGLTRPFYGYELVIPNFLERYPVTIIGRSAFAYTNISNVRIGNYIRLIDDMAFFNCANLMQVTIPADLFRIGNYAFEYCYNLQWFRIPRVRSLGDYILDGCSGLQGISYAGSPAEWKTIQVNMHCNDALLRLPFYYNAANE